MNNLVFGKYMPLDSPIHKLDPRAKILAMLVMLVAVFMPSGWYGYLIIGVVMILVIRLSKLKLSFVIKAFKPMIFMMCFLFIINIFGYTEGTLLLSVGPLKIYWEAITHTLYIVIRLLLMIMITTVLTVTTKPLDLTLGIEYLLKPFKKIGVPSHEIAMMISIALRFIPTIIEETMRIMNSQKARGVDFEEGKLKEKIMAIVSLIVPLFSVAFQRADDLANAMEARGYNPSGTRTRYKQLKYEMRDVILIAGAIIILVMMIMLAIFL